MYLAYRDTWKGHDHLKQERRSPGPDRFRRVLLGLVRITLIVNYLVWGVLLIMVLTHQGQVDLSQIEDFVQVQQMPWSQEQESVPLTITLPPTIIEITSGNPVSEPTIGVTVTPTAPPATLTPTPER